MERLVLIVDQLEEVKRLIVKGDLAALRMALLLLDNASEVLMFRAIHEALARQDMHDRILARAREVMPVSELERFREEMEYKPLTSKERKALIQGYDSKVDFLTDGRRRRCPLPAPMGRVLKVAHKYRNEAYHRDRIRKTTIQPVVTVMFDIVTDLMVGLPPGSISYSSSDNWDEFCTRYGLGGPMGVSSEELPVIVSALKEGIQLDVVAIAGCLANHIGSRIDEMEHSLAFVAESSAARLTPEEELRRIQFWAQYNVLPRDREDPAFMSYRACRSMDDLARWRVAGEHLRVEQDKYQLFGRFADVETEMEPLEEKIHEVAGLLDEAIQLEIDIARGK